jgi:hypothetical protein
MQPVSPAPYQYIGTTRRTYESLAAHLHGSVFYLAKMCKNILMGLASLSLPIAYLVTKNPNSVNGAIKEAKRRFKNARHDGRTVYLCLRNAATDGCWNQLPLQFPRGGASELTHNLGLLLDEANIRVIFNEKIDRLHLHRDEDVIRVELSEQTISSKRVLLTSGSAVTEFVDGDKSHLVPLQTWTSQNRCLIIEDADPSDLSYAHCTGHPILGMVFEATPYAQPKTPLGKRCRVILVYLHSGYKSDARTNDEIMRKLLAWGVVGKSARLLKAYQMDHANPTKTRKSLRDIELQSAPFLKALWSTNLSDSIAENTARWTAPLKPWKPLQNQRYKMQRR